MASLNKAMLIGNLGRDPEIRSMTNGDRVATLSIATSESWTDKTSGEKREKTEWHRVVIFNDGLADVCERYLKKGSKVYIEGQLQTRKWQDQSGADKWTTEIVLQRFGGKLVLLGETGSGGSRRPEPPVDSYEDGVDRLDRPKPRVSDDLDDEIPF